MKNNLKPNRLINEKNPYLLQHAHNPVDWFPWGEEAFAKAKQEDKPVFLSIGYSTCHWCHVMAHESFEDTEVANLMNESFINIKVDREERPDIDGIYMDVCQLLTGSGGWPLTIIMTADKKPFFAGTYFPKNSFYGRIGMTDLIPKIMELWTDRKEDVLQSAEDLTEKAKSFGFSDIVGSINENIFSKAFSSLLSSYDNEYGGFGNSPKFPIPHNLTFLAKYYKHTNEPLALEMLTNTLTKMYQGGMYDHLGYGFHRYSTDRKWIVPHFEKMLYDQAGLANVYFDAYQITKNELFKTIAVDILTYVERDMLSPEGAFYSAEDADSEGIEGKFYLWSAEELKKFLGKDYSFFSEHYNIKDYGNFDSSGGHFESGQNILFRSNYISNNELKEINKKIFTIREERVHPHKDTKILTDWNAMMVSAFVKASQVLQIDKYYNIAQNCLTFIENQLVDSDNRLLHRYSDGESGVFGNADDYAFLIRAYIDIYNVSLEDKYLLKAIELNNHFIEHFWDESGFGFYFTPDYGEELIYRKKEYYDGAIPSSNSVALNNLIDLWKYTADNRIKEIIDNLIKVFASNAVNMTMGYNYFNASYMKYIAKSIEVIIVSDKMENSKNFKDLIVNSNQDNIYTIILTNENINEFTAKAEYLKNYNMKDNKTTIYICQDFQCEQPINDFEEFKVKLKELGMPE